MNTENTESGLPEHVLKARRWMQNRTENSEGLDAPVLERADYTVAADDSYIEIPMILDRGAYSFATYPAGSIVNLPVDYAWYYQQAGILAPNETSQQPE